MAIWFRDLNQVVTWNTTPITRTGRELVVLPGAKPNTEHLHKLGEGFAEHGIRTDLWEVTSVPRKDQIRLDKQLWVVIPNEHVDVQRSTKESSTTTCFRLRSSVCSKTDLG